MNYPILVWWLALAVCVPSVVLSKATSPETNMENYGITWIFLPDENGNPHVVYLDEDTSNEPLVIKVELYNRNNRFRSKDSRTMFIVYNDTVFHNESETLKVIEDFDAQLDTKILTHGFMSDTDGDVVQLIRTAYETHGYFNIFAIDWRNKVKFWTWNWNWNWPWNWDVSRLNPYLRAVDNVPDVGEAVSELMILLDKNGADSKRIHLIGHSLGAHVMGIAGYNFTSKTTKTIGRITGLDPAGPAFEIRNWLPATLRKYYLNSTNADFVDVIHTDPNSTLALGIQAPIGHVDFYPNGESEMQPPCTMTDKACSHSRVYELYAESINSTVGFYAVPCRYSEKGEKFPDRCSGTQILMGDRVPVEARGIYYLKTNKESPFAMGKYDPNANSQL